MKNANVEFAKLVESWNGARTARPSEKDFTPFGLIGVNASDFDVFFSEAAELIAAAANSTRPVNSSQEVVLEALAVKEARELKALVDACRSNGFHWLISQSAFLQRLATLQSILAPIINRRARLRKDVISFAQNQLAAEVMAVEEAAPLARGLVEDQQRITQEADKVSNSLKAAEESANKAKESESEVAALLAKAAEHASKAASERQATENSSEEARALLASAKDLLAKLDKSKIRADTELETTQGLLEQANEQIKKALADINQQALADSFAQQAKRLRNERLLWILGFLSSLGGLVATAVFVVKPHVDSASLAASTADGLSAGFGMSALSGLVHALPFLVPCVWLGWLSARNAGMVGRMQQDYSYKVATALAFQGYRKEVLDLGDEEMLRRLMGLAINNFGDNPIRLYEGTEELGHPLESLKSIIGDDKLYSKFLDCIKALNPKAAA